MIAKPKTQASRPYRTKLWFTCRTLARQIFNYCCCNGDEARIQLELNIELCFAILLGYLQSARVHTNTHTTYTHHTNTHTRARSKLGERKKYKRK
jgi:uncharacterized metal-binding protein